MAAEPESATAPAGAVRPTATTPARPHRLRLALLAGVPALAVLLALGLYLSGGRYVTTEDAYVGAQKVLITPEVSGKVVAIAVSEGQAVRRGDLLFSIGSGSYETAVKIAEAQREQARSDWLDLEASLASLAERARIAREIIDQRKAQLGNSQTLVTKGVTAKDAMRDWRVALSAAQAELASLMHSQAESTARLLGDPDLPLERFPPYMEAEARLEKARRDLDSTAARTPMDGIATQVPNIQIGRYLTAGTPVLAVIASGAPWVEANLKETDLAFVAPGQEVTVTIDTFPGRQWRGRVESISPGTGAQFSILPPQNAAGNWVKVVQRVPVRIAFLPGEDTAALRAGLSAYVAIDTGRGRTLAGLLGLGGDAAAAPAPAP